MTLAVVVFAWLLLTLIGWLLLAPLRRDARDALLPVAPLFGAALLVVVLHDATLIAPVRIGIWLVAPLLVVLGVVAVRRDGTSLRPSRSALKALGLTFACGAVPAVFALGPSLATGDSGVIQPSVNNDAFYYVSVAEWLVDHPATETPEIEETPEEGGVPPSYSPAYATLTLHLRIGQELTHAAITTVLGSSMSQTWYPVTALWVLLMPAGGVAAARFLRLHLATGLLLGTAMSMSALIFFQLASQNSDSLLGVALLFPALGAVVRALGRDPLVPPWLAGLLLTALVGTYTEYVPLVAPALVAAVLARRPRDLGRSLRAAVGVLAFAFVLAPLAWVRAARSLLFLGQMQSDYYPTAFAGAPASVILARFLGVVSIDGSDVPVLLLVLVGLFVLAGVVASLVLSGRRWFYATLLVAGALLAVYMVTVRDRPYTQQRVVQLLLPLVLLVVAVGWDRLWRQAGAQRGSATGRRRRATAGRAQTAVAGVGLAGALVFTVTNGVVDHRMDLPEQAKLRHVGPEFEEAADWVREVGGPEGGGVSVLVGDFFSQLWITDALRRETDVAYPSLFVSYQATTSYWSGDARRWLLTDVHGIRRADDGVVVEENSRFALLDLSKGRAVVAAPADEFGQNSYMLLRSESADPTVMLVGSTRSRAPTDAPIRPEYNDLVIPGLDAGDTRLPVEVRPTVGRRVVLTDDEDFFALTDLRLRD
jgi:hypothetical protein